MQWTEYDRACCYYWDTVVCHPVLEQRHETCAVPSARGVLVSDDVTVTGLF